MCRGILKCHGIYPNKDCVIDRAFAFEHDRKVKSSKLIRKMEKGAHFSRDLRKCLSSESSWRTYRSISQCGRLRRKLITVRWIKTHAENVRQNVLLGRQAYPTKQPASTSAQGDYDCDLPRNLRECDKALCGVIGHMCAQNEL